MTNTAFILMAAVQSTGIKPSDAAVSCSTIRRRIESIIKQDISVKKDKT